MTDKFHVPQNRTAKPFILAFAVAGVLAGAAALGLSVMEGGAGFLLPLLAFLCMAACAGGAVAWLRADTALRVAERAASQATANYVLLANRLSRLERLVQTPPLHGRQKAAEPQAAEAAMTQAPKELPGDRGRRHMIMQAFEADWIELHLQPIVGLPQRKIRFYEALSRLRLADGTLLGPSEFLGILESLGRAPEFDRRVLARALAVARHLVARGSEAIVGVNLSAHSIQEPGFLWSLVGLMDAAPEALGKIVLELPQECWNRLDADRRAALASLRERGVPLSVDRAFDLRIEAKALADLGVRFVKLPAERLIAAADRGERAFAEGERDLRDLARDLRREGIRLVAERVEREEMVPVLADLGVPLAQGFVFAAPRAVKADVFRERSKPQPSSAEGAPVLLHAG